MFQIAGRKNEIKKNLNNNSFKFLVAGINVVEQCSFLIDVQYFIRSVQGKDN